MGKATSKTPNPALKTLDVLVGMWKASDPSGAGAIGGQVTPEWMEGGFSLMQHVDLDGAKGIEIIGSDEESRSLKSHCFGNTGRILEDVYEAGDGTITGSIDMRSISSPKIGAGIQEAGSWRDW